MRQELADEAGTPASCLYRAVRIFHGSEFLWGYPATDSLLPLALFGLRWNLYIDSHPPFEA